MRSRWRPASSIFTRGSIITFPGLMYTSAAGTQSGRRTIRSEGGEIIEALEASRFGAPFLRQRHDTNLPTAWPTPPPCVPGGDTQTTSAHKARPLRNSLIRVLFTARWQAVIIYWLKPDPGPSCTLLGHLVKISAGDRARLGGVCAMHADL